MLNTMKATKRFLDKNKKTWKLFVATNRRVANFSKIAAGTKAVCRKNIMHKVLARYFDTIGNKCFLSHQAQRLEQFLTVESFKAERENVLRSAKQITKIIVSISGNVKVHMLFTN